MAQAIEADSGAVPTSARVTLTPGKRWAVLFLLTLGVLISFIDRSNMGVATADKEGFVKFFSLSDIDRGWIGSVFFWSYGVVQLFMGWLVDRYGVKWLYAIFFVAWCAATVACGLVTAVPALIAARFLVGAAEAVVIPASYRWIRDHFDDTRSGTAIGIFTAGNKMGNSIGTPLAGWLIFHYGWQSMFLVTGLAGLLWLVPWLLIVPNDLPRNEALAEKVRIASTVSWNSILTSPVAWGSVVINYCYGYLGFFSTTWMPSYLHEKHGLTLEASSVYTGLSFAGQALVAIFGGWLADRIIRNGRDHIKVRKAFIVVGFLGACTILLAADADSVSMATFWSVMSLSMLGFATPNLQALCRFALIPSPAVGRVTGVQQVATSLSGGTAALLSGWLLHVSGSYRLPMLMIFVFLVLGAATTLVMMQPKWSPKVNEG